MHREASSRARSGAYALVALSGLAGCNFVRLKHEVEDIKHTAFATGTVTGMVNPTAKIYLFHFADGQDPQVQAVSAAFPQYGVLVAPGMRNDLVAFQDLDGDRRFSPGEPCAVMSDLGGTRPLARNAIELPELALQAGATLDDYALPEPGEMQEPHFEAGTVRTLDDPLFSRERAAEGMWSPLTAVRKGGYGIHFLEPYDPKRTPVVFVHGINGTPLDFEPLIRTLDRSKYQAWVVYYPSGIRLPLLGKVLGQLLDDMQKQTQAPRLVLIAHSMGGLVARASLFELQRRNRASIIHPFISLSTPYGGHESAGSGLEHAPQAVPAWVDLAPGSTFLAQLSRPLPKETPFYLFFGVSGRSNLVGGNNDGVVSVESELAPYAQDQASRTFGFPETHMTILGSEAVHQKLWPLLEL